MDAPSPQYTVRLLRSGRSAGADGGRTVLAALEQGGLALPSSCRNGTCRTCMCRLAGGAVEYRIAWPGLSREERAEGWILPCVAYPLADLALEA